ncbi:uncharacterized protein [Montipora foliosa]|uniref:uncharacterized protein isoform X1 n=1 Tax=Montipora foliosa TaxID=591990 RepID=UPI0035F1618B
MIAYKKQRRKVDPVKQILARLDEKQSKSGLSLYSRSNIHHSEKEDVLPVFQPSTSENAPNPSKSSGYFQDPSGARQRAHRRLNAGLKHSIDESHHKSALYTQAKADKRMNQTFPPAKSNAISALVYQRKESYSFGGWSDTPSAGVENIRNSHYTSMNPFGYNRRTLAFQPTSLNYVVEWPETWPLKIMSLNDKGTKRPNKTKQKVKPKALHRVQFKGSSASGSSPEFLSKKCSNLLSSGAFAPPENHSKQVLQGKPPAQSSMNTSVLQSLLSERHKEGAHQQEEFSLHIGDLKKLPVPDNLIEVQDGKGLENARVHLDTSSSSESEDKKTEVPDKTETQQACNTTKQSCLPSCTPTLASKEQDSASDVKSEGGEGSQSLLMDIVSQIAAEPVADYMQDI